MQTKALAQRNDPEAVEIFRAVDGPAVFGEDGQEIPCTSWQVRV